MTQDPSLPITQDTCGACKGGVEPPFPFTMAFQPVGDTATQTVYSYEALVRGPGGEPASHVLRQVTPANQYAFDQGVRVKAIMLATQLGMIETGAKLSINLIPGAIFNAAACVRQTLEAARENSFPLDRLIFEITEHERCDIVHLGSIATEYRKHGFSLALDDFGAGYSGLTLLADLRTEIIKLDGSLVHLIETRPVAQAIVRSMAGLCQYLGMLIIAEHVETLAEYHCLRACGVTLMQGNLLAPAAFEALPEIKWPTEEPNIPHDADHSAA